MPLENDKMATASTYTFSNELKMKTHNNQFYCRTQPINGTIGIATPWLITSVKNHATSLLN